jgi:signal transduction histidine kinase
MNEVRVLLVDDQAIVAAALKQSLEGEENIVFSYTDSVATLHETIRSFQPTVILQDLVLPNTTGIEVIKEIRAVAEFRDLPIILLSTNEDARTKYAAFMAGANDYVVKFPERFELLGRLKYHSSAYLNLNERERIERQLAQKSRLESLGNLSAGIAHEINTPLQYVGSNINFFKEAFEAMERVLQAVEPILKQAEYQALIKESDVEFLRSEMPDAIRQTSEGVQQISTIVRAMKVFSHPGTEQKGSVHINALLRDIVTVTRNEWKDYSQLQLSLTPEEIIVFGFSGGLSQVILNLIVNASHAIADRVKAHGIKGEIVISSRVEAGYVFIDISDNGGGIPIEHRAKIFDPFFTTKGVGKGTGQGLTIARSIVSDGHGGKLDFSVREGEGTTFTIQLPLLQTAPVTSLDGVASYVEQAVIGA